MAPLRPGIPPFLTPDLPIHYSLLAHDTDHCAPLRAGAAGAGPQCGSLPVGCRHAEGLPRCPAGGAAQRGSPLPRPALGCPDQDARRSAALPPAGVRGALCCQHSALDTLARHQLKPCFQKLGPYMLPATCVMLCGVPHAQGARMARPGSMNTPRPGCIPHVQTSTGCWCGRALMQQSCGRGPPARVGAWSAAGSGAGVRIGGARAGGAVELAYRPAAPRSDSPAAARAPRRAPWPLAPPRPAASPWLQEIPLLHRPSRTLILTDLAFNFKRDGGGGQTGCNPTDAKARRCGAGPANLRLAARQPAGSVLCSLPPSCGCRPQRRRCLAGPWAS